MIRWVPAIFVALLLGAGVVLAAQTDPSPGVWTVDAAHSEVSFSIRHFLTPVSGRFNRFEGAIRFDPDHLEAAEVRLVVQADSIDTKSGERDRHLRSPDFFDVAKYPTLQFESKAFQGQSPNFTVTGDLTIHGVTHEVTVPVEFLGTLATDQGPKAGFAARFTIHRKDYGITWNQSLDQGGAVLGEEVKIRINIEASSAATLEN